VLPPPELSPVAPSGALPEEPQATSAGGVQ